LFGDEALAIRTLADLQAAILDALIELAKGI
jgi:hypothetical protein